MFGYKLINGVPTLPVVQLPKPYFNEKPEYAGFTSFWDPYSKTHTSRLWTTDLNQDGLPDILAAQELWTTGDLGLQKSVFQLLINRGNMVFEDQTDTLSPEFDKNVVVDYSVRFVDIDGSGIDTIFHSPAAVFSNLNDAVKQGQYILVNDGTGRLYAAMHSEFRAMRSQIINFLKSKLSSGITVSGDSTPQFIAYRTSNGLINFVALLQLYDPKKPSAVAAVNVPLQINLATDFRRDLTILTRNGSHRIRTFAGNDTIYRALSDPDCAIDGGLGVNTLVYPGKRNDWIAWRVGTQIKIKPLVGAGGTDTLTRIQTATFSDGTIDLSQIPEGPPKLSNLSVRTTLVANEILTVGFTMRGGPNPVLIRAAGPGLGALGVPGTMPNPRLALFSDSSKVAENDNWAGDSAVSAAISTVGAFPFPSPSSLDAALLRSIDGGRTVQVSGPAGGNLIVEAYDAGVGNGPRLTNLSALNRVGTGGDMLIAGFTLAGNGVANLLIRAGGPSLGALGVPGTLTDPKVELYNSSQIKIGENNDYAGSLSTVFSSVGAFSFVPGAKDAALVVSLPAGGYTVQVSGSDGGTGVAIVEIYELP